MVQNTGVMPGAISTGTVITSGKMNSAMPVKLQFYLRSRATGPVLRLVLYFSAGWRRHATSATPRQVTAMPMTESRVGTT